MTVHTPPEIRLRNAESALRKSQERHQLALLAGGLGSWELDLRTMVLESSDGCKVNFGLAPDDELPYSRLIEMILHEDRPGMQASVARAMETGEDYQADYRIRRPDGQIAWIAAFGRPFFAADGIPDLMLGTTQDITRRKHAEAEREQLLEEARVARDQAEAAVRLRDVFLSSTIHDLRSPLTAMRGRTQLLQRWITRMDLAEEDRLRITENLTLLEGEPASWRHSCQSYRMSPSSRSVGRWSCDVDRWTLSRFCEVRSIKSACSRTRTAYIWTPTRSR